MCSGGAVESGYAVARSFADKWNKETWVTEWGPMFAWGSDLGMSLYMARQIIESVNIMGASAWCYWQPIDSYFAWTLVNVSRWDVNAPLDYVFSKKYFILKQFSWNAGPGSYALNLNATSDCRHGVAAFYDLSKRSLSIFAVNQQPGNRSMVFNLQGYRQVVTTIPISTTHYRTSLLENFAQAAAPSADLSAPFQLDLLGRSFSTVVISNIAPADSPLFKPKKK